MPTSAVCEMQIKDKSERGVTFQEGDDPMHTYSVPIDVWKALGSPDTLRIRIEDAWNDPERKW